ncbi:heme peroxidase [Lodderomyces elongisporus]|uniref:heme peroxidase n=1 Tax=Lodderomyces elongisporus TaxID=36914 RepID=UPI00292576AB|nr:heme peroxidase [Lodderomyces elongisporus]WLF78304.1 heme peroxidase [Lodderomyces elongisporus]
MASAVVGKYVSSLFFSLKLHHAIPRNVSSPIFGARISRGLLNSSGVCNSLKFTQIRSNSTSVNNDKSTDGGNETNANVHKGPKFASAPVGPSSNYTIKIAKVPEGKTQKDYQEVYNDIAAKLAAFPHYDKDDGYYAVLVRMAFHLSGTYSKGDNTGGSYGGTMIFPPEEMDFQNNGLQIARSFLDQFLYKYPWISRGDLWTLAGVCAVQECGGPKVEWAPGRVNDNKGVFVPPNGRIPDGGGDGAYVRKTFARMGLGDRETVALIGAHVLGRCHVHNTGYDGPWGDDVNRFTNDFFQRLLQKWHIKNWSGRKQYEDDETNQYMMLPTDMSLKTNDYFRKYVELYAKDKKAWFDDFSAAFAKLLALGITYPEDTKVMVFPTLEDQAGDPEIWTDD